VESAFYRSYEGTGLGLSLVQSLSDLHGAELAIDSQPGRGTTVSILFPAARTVAVEDAQSA
jgi:signal transduction histidine kinase